MTITVFSLGQFVNSDIQVLQRNLYRLSNQEEITQDQVWNWFKDYLPHLRLNAITLDTIREAFNAKFHTTVDADTFLNAFNEMATFSEATKTKILTVLEWLKQHPELRILLVSHTNIYHLEFILKQIDALGVSIRNGVLGASEYSAESSVVVASSMHMRATEHDVILNQALQQMGAVDEPMISFLDSVTRAGVEKRSIIYQNPGKQWQHFFNYFNFPNASQLVTRHLVMNLGDLLNQDRTKAIAAFLALMQPMYNQPIPLQEVLISLVMHHETAETGLIRQCKLGTLTQDEFIAGMIQDIQEKTGVVLNSDQFCKAWQSMNPSFDDVKLRLESVLAECAREQMQLAWVSSTNPLDMQAWKDELKKQDAPYTLENGNLVAFCECSLMTSYHYKQSKPEMVDWYVRDKNSSSIIYISTNRANNEELNRISRIPNVIVIHWNKSQPIIDAIQAHERDELTLNVLVSSSQVVTTFSPNQKDTESKIVENDLEGQQKVSDSSLSQGKSFGK